MSAQALMRQDVWFLRGLEFVMSKGPSDWFEWAAWRSVFREALAGDVGWEVAKCRADTGWRKRSEEAADRLLAEVLAS